MNYFEYAHDWSTNGGKEGAYKVGISIIKALNTSSM